MVLRFTDLIFKNHRGHVDICALHLKQKKGDRRLGKEPSQGGSEMKKNGGAAGEGGAEVGTAEAKSTMGARHV